MSLVSRYVLRECVAALLVVVSVLFVILMSNQFAEILGEAAADELPREAVFSVLGLTSLRYLTMLAPIGLFLGVLLALARLSRDSEMAALSACGIGPSRLLRPIALLAVTLAGVISWFALVQTPAASARIEQIKLQARESLQISAIEAGKFATPDSGDTVVYAREVKGDELYDVFVQRHVGGRVAVILAERGKRVHDAATGTMSFVLFDGTRYEGVPGSKTFSIVHFGEHGIPIRADEDEEYVVPVETRPTAALLGSRDPADAAELQWRISSPLSLLVLALLAVPLSRSSPREGRYSRIGAGLLLYIIYANSLSIARVWVERGYVPEWIGMWWVHAAAALLGILLLGRESGWFARAPRIEPAEAAS
ncbi:MAG TPA: LPS export ABC transporter permease LptF [Gammaproteobacteria bacterium]